LTCRHSRRCLTRMEIFRPTPTGWSGTFIPARTGCVCMSVEINQPQRASHVALQNPAREFRAGFFLVPVTTYRSRIASSTSSRSDPWRFDSDAGHRRRFVMDDAGIISRFASDPARRAIKSSSCTSLMTARPPRQCRRKACNIRRQSLLLPVVRLASPNCIRHPSTSRWRANGLNVVLSSWPSVQLRTRVEGFFFGGFKRVGIANDFVRKAEPFRKCARRPRLCARKIVLAKKCATFSLPSAIHGEHGVDRPINAAAHTSTADLKLHLWRSVPQTRTRRGKGILRSQGHWGRGLTCLSACMRAAVPYRDPPRRNLLQTNFHPRRSTQPPELNPKRTPVRIRAHRLPPT